MADKLRNEVDIEFKGKKVVMRATVDAIRGIENDLRLGIVRVSRDFGEANYGMNHIVTVLRHGMKEGGNEFSAEDIADEVMKIGIDQGRLYAILFVNASLEGQSLGKPQEVQSS